MPTTNIAKQIYETIRERAPNDPPLQEFISAILKWELDSKGTFQFKENYRQRIRLYASKWGGDK